VKPMRSVALLCALLLSACAAPKPAVHAERPRDFVKVIDGRTLKVRGELVRISNIEAPELPPHAKCWAEGALAVQASDRLRAMIEAARSISVERSGEDHDGLALARVLLNRENDVGQAMVFQGVAAKANGKPWSWCGAADYAVSGPGVTMGPEANSAFASWVADHPSASGLDDEVQRVASIDAGFSREP